MIDLGILITQLHTTRNINQETFRDANHGKTKHMGNS